MTKNFQFSIFNFQKRERGFTALELLIGLAILGILAVIVLAPFSSYRTAQIVNATALEIAALLNDARTASISSKEGSSYGVHFESGRAVYFKGTVFSEPSSYNKTINLDSSVSIPAINLNGGGADVVFERLTGETDDFGTIVVRSSTNAPRQKTITVSQTGIVSHN